MTRLSSDRSVRLTLVGGDYPRGDLETEHVDTKTVFRKILFVLAANVAALQAAAKEESQVFSWRDKARRSEQVARAYASDLSIAKLREFVRLGPLVTARGTRRVRVW